MPYINEVDESFNPANDSGISLDGLMSSIEGDDNDTRDVLHLHVIKDADVGLQIPFLSRSVAWAFCVEWLWNENPCILVEDKA